MTEVYEHHMQRALWGKYRSSTTVMLPNYTPHGWYECDLYIVTKRLYTVECEIKRTVEDFRADTRKRTKHMRLAQRTGPRVPTRFFYVVPDRLIQVSDVPEYAGLMFYRMVGERYPHPRLVEAKAAPRLNTNRVTEKAVRAMRQTSYWRFWWERFAFEDYRRDVVRGNWAGAKP
jgi:hypothetical protein